MAWYINESDKNDIPEINPLMIQVRCGYQLINLNILLYLPSVN